MVVEERGGGGGGRERRKEGERDNMTDRTGKGDDNTGWW